MLSKTVFWSILVLYFVTLLMSNNQVEAKSRFLKKLEKRSDADLSTEFEDVTHKKTIN